MLGSMAVMGAAFTSCSKDVAFDSEGLANQAAEQLKAEYRANFEKKFGVIDPNQTWVFSTMKSVSGLPSTGSAARTRTGEVGEVSVNLETSGNMLIEKDAINWMKTNMKPINPGISIIRTNRVPAAIRRCRFRWMWTSISNWSGRTGSMWSIS